MNTRITVLRKHLNQSMDSFGSKLGVTRSAISRIESGKVGVSNQIINSICREFNVNEKWLRTGEGEMFNDLSKNEQVAKAIGKALNTNNKFILNTFLALAEMPESVWDDVQDFIDKIKKNED